MRAYTNYRIDMQLWFCSRLRPPPPRPASAATDTLSTRGDAATPAVAKGGPAIPGGAHADSYGTPPATAGRHPGT